MALNKKIEQPDELMIKFIDEQIAMLKQKIASWEANKRMILESPGITTHEAIPLNAPLTRDLIRKYIRNHRQPVRTIEVIEFLYPEITEDEKAKHIKVLSVIFNNLKKEGYVTVEKKEGIKGNFYTYNVQKQKKHLPTDQSL